MELLSPNFSLAEMVASEKAKLHNLENNPNDTQKANLKALCLFVLQPIRNALQKPVEVNSGFRSPKVNKLVGGASDSQHLRGQAADIVVEGMSVDDLIKFILAQNIVFDQMILEFNQWVHISFKKTGKNRNQVLIATYGTKGKAVYKKYQYEK